MSEIEIINLDDSEIEKRECKDDFHLGNPEIYCEDCDEINCLSCIRPKHSRHLLSPINYISTTLKKNYEDRSKGLSETLLEYEKNLKVYQDFSVNLKNLYDKSLEDLSQTFKDIHSELNLKEASMRSEMHTYQENNLVGVTSSITELQDRIKTIKDLLKINSDNALSSSTIQVKQETSDIDNNKKREIDIQTIVQNYSKFKKIGKLQLKVDECYFAFLDDPSQAILEIKSLGLLWETQDIITFVNHNSLLWILANNVDPLEREDQESSTKLIRFRITEMVKYEKVLYQWPIMINDKLYLFANGRCFIYSPNKKSLSYSPDDIRSLSKCIRSEIVYDPNSESIYISCYESIQDKSFIEKLNISTLQSELIFESEVDTRLFTPSLTLDEDSGNNIIYYIGREEIYSYHINENIIKSICKFPNYCFEGGCLDSSGNIYLLDSNCTLYKYNLKNGEIKKLSNGKHLGNTFSFIKMKIINDYLFVVLESKISKYTISMNKWSTYYQFKKPPSNNEFLSIIQCPEK